MSTAASPMSIRAALALVCALVAAALGLGLAAAPAQSAPRVTVIGDSVQASFAFTPSAPRLLGRGLALRMEARSCRALSRPGCLGGQPPSAVALAQGLGPRMGDVVVVHVGYNDFAEHYDAGAAMAAFRRAGVRAVVWTTLREAHGHYARTNVLIRQVAQRAARRGDQPLVRVADWNAHSAGHGGWFTPDRVHLNGAGAMALAAFQREAVLSVLAELGTSIDGRPITTRLDAHRLPVRADAMAADGDRLWLAGAGRITARDDHNGHAVPRATALAAGERLVGDGRAAWLADGAVGALTRVNAGAADRRGRRVEDAGAAPVLAAAGEGAGARTWALAACEIEATVCPTGQGLRGIGAGDEAPVDATLSPGTVTHIGGGRRALWVAATDPAGRARLERRDPTTGRLVGTVHLARPPAGVAAGLRGAWVLDRRGDLLRVSAGGKVTRTQRGLRAVAARDDQLWAVRRDGRTVVNLHPVSARVRGEARAGVRLSDAMAITNRHVWVLSKAGRSVVRLPRA